MKQLAVVLSILLAGALAETAGVGRARAGDAALDHPDIVAIREIYQMVEQEISQGRLKKQARTIEDCGRFGETRTICSDAKGAIRKYVLEGGSEDSTLTISHYYDGRGRLRFAFVTGGAVNDTRMEQRIYFNERGARIRDDKKITAAGPGYPFASLSDAEGLLSPDPRRAYERACVPAGPR